MSARHVRPVGRPPVDPQDKQSRAVMARFTPAEYATLEALAAANGCTIAQLVRGAALSRNTMTLTEVAADKVRICCPRCGADPLLGDDCWCDRASGQVIR